MSEQKLTERSPERHDLCANCDHQRGHHKDDGNGKCYVGSCNPRWEGRCRGFVLYRAIESLMDERDPDEDDHALDELHHLLTPLISHLAAQPAAWQGIESTPRPGTPRLLVLSICPAHGVLITRDEGHRCPDYDGAEDIPYAAPLPAPPVALEPPDGDKTDG